MTAEPRLVHIVDDVPALDGLSTLTMVVVLDGFLDAGNAAAIAARHLIDTAPPTVDQGDQGGRVVATFDVDQLHDYRARRPPMSFVRDHYEAYDAPRLVVRLLQDTGHTPYLLLHGPEPDTRWEGFAAAVREVVERFGVTRVVGMGSVPMAVPHTRPIAITPHANDADLIIGESRWRGELRIPSSAQSLLEVRLGEWGTPGAGLRGAHPALPRAARLPARVRRPARAGRARREAHGEPHRAPSLAEEREGEITRYLAANEEVGDVVSALERQYDAFERAEESGTSLLAGDQPLPTGEEIGQQFEQFLAGLETPPDDPDASRGGA